MKRRADARISSVEVLEQRMLLSAVARPAYNTGTGFFVSGGKVYDANGIEFVMKGVNMNHAWGSYNNNYNTIDQIAKTGANAVRAVMYQDIAVDAAHYWTDSADTPARRRAVAERYLANGMVAVVEDHASIQDSSSQSSTAALHEVTTHWLDNQPWLKQHERGVILNIANEWGPVVGANGGNTTWRDAYITQVGRLRRGLDGVIGTGDDVTNLICIDAAGWGQDFNSLALHAQQILDADPQHNLLFSIHLYGQWRDENRSFEVAGGNTDYGPWDILTRLSSLKNRAQPLPLVIGEWAWEDFRDFSNTSSPYAGYRTRRVMQIADQLGIGHTGWSWNGSGPGTLNMVAGSLNNTTYNTNTDLSEWGDALVNDPTHGFKGSARRATVFPLAGFAPPPSGLPALPTSMPATTKLILAATNTTVPEGGSSVLRVRLSEPPTSNVTVTLSKASGDADLSLGTTTLTFTPGNWNQDQLIQLSALGDADTAPGTAKFRLASPGLLTTDFVAREIESTLPMGSVTLNPVADRGYAGNATATGLTVTATTQPQPSGAMFMRFDLAGRGGRVASAMLRVFKTTATNNLTVRLHFAYTDDWTEAGTTGINASYPLLSKLAPNAGNTYVDFDVTAIVGQQMFRDGLISFALSTASGTAAFQTREGVNKPQLVLNMVEAVPPRVVSSRFDHEQVPHRLLLSFDEDVSGTLSAADVLLESLSTPGVSIALSATPTWDAATKTAAFTFTTAVVPDGRYRMTLLSPAVADAAGNALLRGTSLEFFSLAGDVNRNGAVDFDDLLALAQNYGQGNATHAQGDLNDDGVVNFDDLLSLAQNYGRTAAVAAAPPTIGVTQARRTTRASVT